MTERCVTKEQLVAFLQDALSFLEDEDIPETHQRMASLMTVWDENGDVVEMIHLGSE